MTAVSADLPGVTTVSGRAVRRIAARAAREVDGVAGAVEVAADISGDRTSLDIRLPVRYPEPVGRVTDACRAHLLRRTEELTGLGVTRVDIAVTELAAEVAPAGRVR
ncbi:Asp23/Gls24 family envelope stress response protein [Nocardia carnea]|uniref:Asp23/Gls24 family envelope stress response protein n=1 Tax=Nocardia carnea TaxID=37328 RepID=UPI0024537920|nr:Asp23/Gls24 family envelope stress response protein [Nocardia carnea]